MRTRQGRLTPTSAGRGKVTLRHLLTNFSTVSLMLFDLDNPVMQWCAAGMQVDGEPEKARALFERAWAARRDDFDTTETASPFGDASYVVPVQSALT
ncbi:MAG: hypothetical protein ABJB66_10985 [Gemmatimonadaceae bacterium]